MQWFRRFGPALLGALLFAIAIALLHRELAGAGYADLVREMHAVSAGRVALAVALTVASYALLTLYDALALAHLGRTLGYARTALASFTAYVASHNLGLSWIGGGAVRLRVYGAFGLSGQEVTTITAFAGLTSWLGLLAGSGVVLLAAPGEAVGELGWSRAAAQLVGSALLALVLAYLALCRLRRAPLRIRGLEFAPPTWRTAAAQVALGLVDWLVAALVLRALLPDGAQIGAARFALTFVSAHALGMLSHVPGGIGVFEYVFVKSLGPELGSTTLVGVLLVYRAVYYVLPLACGLVAFSAFELSQRARSIERLAALVAPAAAAVLPTVLAAWIFLVGAMLLASGATPPEPGRHRWLRETLTLPVIELSHLAGSVVGTLLLLLADGVRRRIDAAHRAVLVLLAVGAAASLAKGLDWEEAGVLAALALALLLARRRFDRRAAILHSGVEPSWWLAVLVVAIGVTWLTWFAHPDSDLSSEQWWRFALDAHASRSMRAWVVVVAVLASASVWLALRIVPPADLGQDRADELVRAVVGESPATYAHLALAGDKRFLVDRERRGFVMFKVQGRSWVAMGDPVGPPDARRALAWRFHELAQRSGGRAVFYQVASSDLATYAELGLALLKIGERARVDIAAFDLHGRSRKHLRQAERRVAEAGCEFEVAPFGSPRAPAAELRALSDAWLAARSTREKGFSLGRFDEDYLRGAPIALVRRGERIVAFANLWLGAGREELSLDLMRRAEDAPDGAMDFLFVRLLEWGREQGYRWFDLGMAPLAGLESRPGATAWQRLGALVFHHAEHFYNFEGLRAFKAKFDPVWEPRFIAAPGGLALPGVLADVTIAVSGGALGLIAR